MIIKPYEFQKINYAVSKVILMYGKNEGYKKEIIKNINQVKNEILNYDQNEIIENENILFENIFSGSLFNNKKIIIVRRITDKFLNIIEKIDADKIEDSIIILIADNLEKKSKLRSKFEKNKNFICMPFYPDNDQVLVKLAYNFFRDKKIPVSNSIINLVTNKCNGDREVLLNELNKIELYSKNGKTITEENLTKLINLIENHNISELINNYLVKNNKKTANILNENNFSNEDCVLITRTFLNKAKRLLNLSKEYQEHNDVELAISSAKPPIFWKDKEITKQQIYKWKPEKIQKLIYKLNELELHTKKNINLGINLITDFILDKKFII
jgi:DNA polymerase-3 subunit delta